MYDFLTKLFNASFPKIRDFKGFSNKSFDGKGNYTFGIKEDIIFPEINLENVDRVRGFDITIVTSTNDDKQAQELLNACGFPFKKQ